MINGFQADWQRNKLSKPNQSGSGLLSTAQLTVISGLLCYELPVICVRLSGATALTPRNRKKVDFVYHFVVKKF